jgi:hypothetical protein
MCTLSDARAIEQQKYVLLNTFVNFFKMSTDVLIGEEFIACIDLQSEVMSSPHNMIFHSCNGESAIYIQLSLT